MKSGRNSICLCGCNRKYKVCKAAKQLEAEQKEKERQEKRLNDLSRVIGRTAAVNHLAVASAILSMRYH